MISKFHIEKQNGAVSLNSRAVFKEQFAELPDGWHKITIEPSKTGKYTPSRYKYYFAHVLPCILEKCAGRFQVISHDTGEQRPIRNTTELHEGIKYLFNPVTVITPKGAFTTGGTTTNLSDREFIGEYLETILAEFSSPPYNVEFLDYDGWRESYNTPK